jgi:transcriptional regulator with XRE-family HTH domain
MGTQTTTEVVRMSLGKRIRSLRKTNGWTQEELAEHAELSHKYIGEVERGEVNPSLDTLLSIANALKVEIARLFSCDQMLVLKKNEISDIQAALNVLNNVLGDSAS